MPVWLLHNSLQRNEMRLAQFYILLKNKANKEYEIPISCSYCHCNIQL